MLVVDDELDARELIAAVLTGRGAEVVFVESAGEALKEMERQQFDVLSLGHRDAVDGRLCADRESSPASGRAAQQNPAAALTAYAGIEDRMRVLSAGYQVHIAKPVEPAELMTVVANLAGRYAAQSI